MASQGSPAVSVIMAALLLVLGLVRPGDAAVFDCASGDVACLIAAVNTANGNGQANTIRLEPGTYTLRTVDNGTDGSNGLPSMTSPLAIVGAGAGITIIEREAAAPPFRVIHVAQAGLLKLQGLTVRGGLWGGDQADFGGGGLLNHGTAVISRSALTDNETRTEGSRGGGGGAIASLGRLVIAGSIIAKNKATRGFGGGVFSRAGVLVVNSTISDNAASDGGGGLWTAADSMTIIVGSTIADNRSTEGHGGGLHTESTSVAIVNSTLARNSSGILGFGGALFVSGGIIVNATIADNRAIGGPGQAIAASSALALYNTIVSGPSHPANPACRGPVTSLGNNLFIDPGCAVALLPQDVTGDARLGDFTDDGTPGHGFVPLLRRSPAINAADAAGCLPSDQRGRRRVRASCDIGAIEGTR